jgi:hypothetical protein
MLVGSLFTRDFLAEGIMQEADWKHLSDAAAKAMGECFPAGLSESAYKTADFPSNLNLLRSI